MRSCCGVQAALFRDGPPALLREAPIKAGVNKLHSVSPWLVCRDQLGYPFCGRKKKLNNQGVIPHVTSTQFCNVRGLSTNLNAVHHHLQSCSPVFLALTETQISPPSSLNHLNCPGFELYDGFFQKGGVCAFVRSDCRSSRISSFDVVCKDFQIIWFKLYFGSSPCIVAVIYRSPNSESDDTFFAYLSDSVESLISSHPDAEVVLLGDFNVHNSNWLSCSRSTDSAGLELESFCILNSFDQLVSGPTRIPDRSGDFASTLDLFLTTNSDSYQDVEVSAPIGTSDHNLISVSRFPSSSSSRKSSKRRLWKFEKADWDGMRDFIGQFPWYDWLRCCSSSETADRITDVLLLGMKCFIPYSYSPGSAGSPKWFSSECARAVDAKNRCFRSYKDNPTSDIHKAYREARNYCSKVIDSAKKDFIQRTALKLCSCPAGSRSFWSLSKAVCNNFCTSSFPPILDSNGVSVNDSFAKANIFADTFASNSYLPPHIVPPLVPPVPKSSMPALRISTRVVRRHLISLDPNKATGPDEVPATVLIRCAPELAPILCRLFKLCLRSGECPSSWKSAHVVPVPKKGNRSDPSNYRPIAITPLMCKVFESLISDALIVFLKSNDLISDRQYGFQKGRSAGDLLSYVFNLWAKALDRFGETVAVALDFSKAFDRVWHEGLIYKLRCIGVHSSIIFWIKDFLVGRSIAVRVDGVLSDCRSINCGVPQGCVLSPILFLIFINDLLDCSHNDIHSFADDSTLHSSIAYTSQLNCNRNLVGDRTSQDASLNTDISEILRWGCQNRANFNDKKTQVVKFSLKHQDNPLSLSMSGSDLSFSNSLSLLGVSMSSNLSWKNHIHQVAKNASRRLGILFRARQYFTATQLLILYKSQVRPVMEYCSHIWAGSSACDLAILDRIQSKAVRLINDSSLTCYLQSLSHRRSVSCLALFYRYYHGRCSSEIAESCPKPRSFSRSTRCATFNNPYSVIVPRCRTSVYKASFFPRTASIWNKVPLACFPLRYDLQKFKVLVNRLPLDSFL